MMQHFYKKFLFSLVAIFMLGCGNQQPTDTSINTLENDKQNTVIQKDTFSIDSPTEAKMRALGLVDITEVDSSIQVHLVYATADNFTGKALYEDVRKAFVLPVVANKLAQAQRALKALHPDYSLMIYDAARPLSVQRQMWEVAKATGQTHYVANPERGNGLHNYGAAVDVTIVDGAGRPLPMGTPFDWFGPEAHITAEGQLVTDGSITETELQNRLLLRKIMTDSGMLTIRSEWWHFELMRGARARQELQILDF